MSSLRGILDHLASHLAGLKEEGERHVPVGPAWSRRNAAAPAPVAPSKAVAAAIPVATAKPIPAAKAAAATVPVLWQRLARLPECGDGAEDPARSLLLVTRASEFEGEAGELLRAMLAAIGFALAGQASPLVQGDEAKGQAARALCFGEEAFQLLYPMGMGLNMSRGKWLATRAGKTLSSFAPSYLLGYPAGKKTSWSDLQEVLQELGLPLPPRK